MHNKLLYICIYIFQALVSKNENAIDKYHALQERAVHYWAVTVKQIERKGR